MAQVDTSMYNALGARPKSVSEYSAEMDAADMRKQGMQQNALSLQMGQQKLDEYGRSVQDANALRGVVRGFGADPTQNVMSLYGAGRLTEAQDYQKAIDESRKAGASATKDTVETEQKMLDGALKKQSFIAQLAGSAVDQASWERNLDMAAQIGADVSRIPRQFDPNTARQLAQTALTSQQQLEARMNELKFAETSRHNKAGEGLTARGQDITVRGQNLTDVRAKEGNDIKASEVAQGGKPPPGYRWAGDGRLEAIPGGPGDKLPEKQQNQVIGTQNLSNAIKEYRDELKGFGLLDAVKPDSRAAMGTKYNNMMLQAKEAYNLGVLNGPDLEILTSVITDPRSFKGAVTSNKALDAQASELDRIMGVIGSVSATRRPQDAKPAAAATTAGAFSDAEKERRYQEWKARQK